MQQALCGSCISSNAVHSDRGDQRTDLRTSSASSRSCRVFRNCSAARCANLAVADLATANCLVALTGCVPFLMHGTRAALDSSGALLGMQVKKADDCIGPEVEKAVKELKNGEVRGCGEVVQHQAGIYAADA